MRKRFYILFVARDAEGQLRKIPIPIHYLYVFLAGAMIGMFTITGIAGSYTRMLMKVSQFNELRAEKDNLRNRYSELEQVSKEKDIQVASLGLIASEVSAIYGLKQESRFLPSVDQVKPEQVKASLDQLYALRNSAITGAATAGLEFGKRNATLSDWVRASEAPSLWPVAGRLTSSFGERIDPFNGEGAFHRGVDISSAYGNPIVAPADGVVEFAGFMSGYGRLIKIDHGHGLTTRYGHLSGFAVRDGQSVKRGDVIGYVGTTGRVTSPHLHYEVRINETPVNPHKYLRTTVARTRRLAQGS
ncbi:MAG TPA: M23 family metallopeptidase [Clostridia bacterium]|nr:M23 family metallopeptidase [Clostridia bacterium]